MEKQKKLKNTKKIIISIIIILLISISIGILIYKININTRKILIESSHINWAWGFSYYGMVICENGDIYEFSFPSEQADEFSNSSKSLKKLDKLIFKNSTKVGSINKEDLNKIKELSKSIDNSTFTKYDGGWRDFGTTELSIWNYRTNSEITISQYGDWAGENSNPNVQELIKILNNINF